MSTDTSQQFLRDLDKDCGEPFDEKMPRLVPELHAQFVESAKLEQAIKENLSGMGYGEAAKDTPILGVET